jgi:glycosyltransferase involved in cell wall biosynthesis
MAPDVEFVAVDPPVDVELPPGVSAGPKAPAVPTNLARAALALPLAVRAARLDLFHAPAYTAPLWGRTPVVLTVHDVSYARRPEFYAHPAGPVRQWFYRQSVMRAVRVLTDSSFSRDEIVAAYGIPADTIDVVPLGVGETFRPAPDAHVGVALPAGIHAPYVLHAGDLHPRRDVVTALRAVLQLRRTHPLSSHPVQLVCAGRDHGSAESLRTIAAEAGFPDALVLAGPVSEGVLVALYQGAACYVYPSLYEGFGLPLLEAMACGLPVIAAYAGSIPEVLGDAGILVPPGDADAMAAAIVLLSSDATERARLVACGLDRATRFTWERTARQTLDGFRTTPGLVAEP